MSGLAMPWRDDRDLFQIARAELSAAVIGDVMDKLGLYHQFLPQPIQPLERNMILAGRAMPVLEADLAPDSPPARPFGLMLEALDSLQLDEVYITTGASPSYALWGELMSRRALRCGAAGAVLDGFSRDTRGILTTGFPVFSRGSYAQDQAPRGHVVDFRIAIEIEGVRISPGDILFGDCDGVCVVPRSAERDVFTAALEKARAEKTVAKALDAGMPAGDAFAKFGVL